MLKASLRVIVAGLVLLTCHGHARAHEHSLTRAATCQECERTGRLDLCGDNLQALNETELTQILGKCTECKELFTRRDEVSTRARARAHLILCEEAR